MCHANPSSNVNLASVWEYLSKGAVRVETQIQYFPATKTHVQDKTEGIYVLKIFFKIFQKK